MTVTEQQERFQGLVNRQRLTREQFQRLLDEKRPDLQGQSIEDLGMTLQYADPAPPPAPARGMVAQFGMGATESLPGGHALSEAMGLPITPPTTTGETVARTMGEYTGYSAQFLTFLLGAINPVTAPAAAAFGGARAAAFWDIPVAAQTALANYVQTLAKANPHALLGAEALWGGVAGAGGGAVRAMDTENASPEAKQIAELFAALATVVGVQGAKGIIKGGVNLAKGRVKSVKRFVSGESDEAIQQSVGKKMGRVVGQKELEDATATARQELERLIPEDQRPPVLEDAPLTTAQTTKEPSFVALEEGALGRASEDTIVQQAAKRDTLAGAVEEKLGGVIPTETLPQWPTSVGQRATVSERVQTRLAEQAENAKQIQDATQREATIGAMDRAAEAESELAATIRGLGETPTREDIGRAVKEAYQKARKKARDDHKQRYNDPAILQEAESPVDVPHLRHTIEAIIKELDDPTVPRKHYPEYLDRIIRALKGKEELPPIYATEGEAFAAEAAAGQAVGPPPPFMPKAYLQYEKEAGQKSVARLLLEGGGVKRVPKGEGIRTDVGRAEQGRAVPQWAYRQGGKALDEHIAEIQAVYPEIQTSNDLLAALEAQKGRAASPPSHPMVAGETRDTLKGKLSFTQVNNIISALKAEQRQLGHQAGPSAPISHQTKRILDEAEADMEAFVKQSGNDALQQANKIYRTEKAILDDQALLSLRRRQLVAADATPDEAVVAELLKSRGRTADAFLRVFPHQEEAQQAIRSALERDLYDKTVIDGAYSAADGRRWMKTNRWVQEKYPEVWADFKTIQRQAEHVKQLQAEVKGAIKQEQVRGAQGQQAVASIRGEGPLPAYQGTREQRRLRLLREIVTRPRFARDIQLAQEMLGIEPSAMARDILGSSTKEAAKKIESVRGLLKGNKVALRGFQREVWHELEQLYAPRMAAADADRATILKEMLTKHESVLSSVFAGNKEALGEFAFARRFLNRLTVTRSPKEYQYARVSRDIEGAVAAETAPTLIAKLLPLWISRGYAVQKHKVGKTWVATTEGSRRMMNYFQRISGERRAAIFAEALFDPEVLRTYQMMTRGVSEKIVKPRLLAHIAAIFGQPTLSEEEGGSP